MHNGTTAPTRTVAAYLLLTPHRVRQLIGEGVLANAKRNGRTLRGRFSLIDAVNGYVRYLRSKASRSAAGTDFSEAKTRQAVAQTQLMELELQERKGGLHRSADVEFHVTQYYTFFKAGALALPSRVAHSLVGRTSVVEINTILTDAVHELLNNTADFKIPQRAIEEHLRREFYCDNGEEPIDERTRQRQLKQIRAVRKDASRED
jgi:hypothetical protein